MIIGLVRHGETEWNSEGKMQGKTNVALSDKGRFQCKMLREKVRKTKYDVCFSSPLFRTIETAMILVGEDTTILKDERIIERDLGEYEGKNYSEYSANDYWNYHLNSNKAGVEPVQNLFKRAREFIDYLKRDFSDKMVLVVTHGALYKALYHLLNNTDIESEDLNMTIETCAYHQFEIEV